ncbi:hypothetical protein ACGF8B_39630 [Streptomyces sp. NPDC047917]|uniref:hypothetical protein n=1 Tax=Streptomyces sp. NPDC047917 TaxID=3365491 RepID=UPI00371FD776
MIIDRNANVTPNRFESPWLRRTIGKRIGRANRDDMLQALIWVTEVRIADDVAQGWSELHMRLHRECTDAEKRRDRLLRQRSDQIASGCHAAASELADELREELQGAAEALMQCAAIRERFSKRLGLDLDSDGGLPPDTRAALGVLDDQLHSAKERFGALVSRDREALHRLAERERYKRRSASTPGRTMSHMDALNQDGFDSVIQQALECSGFQAIRRGPRVIEATRNGARSLVFCANVLYPSAHGTTGVRMILTAQRVAAADAFQRLLVISNLPFISRPADRIMEERTPSARLMQRNELQQWVEWGIPLRNVLEEN